MKEPDDFGLQQVTLELIALHDGAWGWYQLDRALSAQGILNVDIGQLIDHLRVSGLIVVEGDPVLASSHFKVTEAGHARLKRSG